MFQCRFCPAIAQDLKQHLQHRTLHSNLSNRFWCGFEGCPKSYEVEISLQSHLRRVHQYFGNKKQSPAASIVDPLVKFECTISRCKKVLDNRSALIKHLKIHISNEETIECPYVRCNKTYQNVNSFTSHLSKIHRSTLTEDTQPLGSEENDNESNDVANIADANQPIYENEEPVRYNFFEHENPGPSKSSSDAFLINVAQLWLKLECQFLIPVSTIQHIISETFSVHQQSQIMLKKNLELRLIDEGLSMPKINDILDVVCNDDLYVKCNDVLNTNFKRKKFYHEHFSYVQPIEVSIDADTTNPKFFHYVPIAETLIELFTDKSLEVELNSDLGLRDENILSDFTDGSVFKKSIFFKENADGLKLILYQDSFEVVNPIGSAAQKHKILAVYLSVGNLSEHVRSHINSIKLVALCKEKEFDDNKVYGRITEDLKKIEDDGIQLRSGKVIKGAVVFITGDNLGSHQLGGFVENFSTAKYICRYCLMTRDDLYNVDTSLQRYETRTIDSYKEAVRQIGNHDNYQGVKFDSIFNTLNNYHVCQPGLPPCLGHDLLEGVVAYDVKLFLDCLVEERWFSYSLLNKRIKSFTYSTADQRDKPCFVSEKKKRIVGGALQVWSFLRLLPLLIDDKIVDIYNEFWRLILLLTEIVEIVCASSIHKSYLSYLEAIINEYLALRLRYFPRLRPKHHYLTHYPSLILQFGPLMKVWTMRFESKHTYFKRTLRFSRNYLNITKSLSEKHELFQSFLRSGADIRTAIELKGNHNFDINLYNKEIGDAVRTAHLPHSVQDCNQIVVKGTVYQKGTALIVQQNGYQYNVEVGRVCIILSDEEIVFFVVEVLETVFRPDLRAYQVGRRTRYTCLPLHSLPSWEPLHIYKIGNMLCIKQNYGFVQRPL